MTYVQKWPEACDQALRRLAADGLSSGQVREALARDLGFAVTRSAVLGRAHRLGLKFHGQQIGPGAQPARRWTPEMDAVLREGYEIGTPTATIASSITARFGVDSSVEACQARAQRLGLRFARRPSNLDAVNASRPRPRRSAAQRPAKSGPIASPPIAPVGPEPMAEPADEPTADRCTIMELTAISCRWPIGHPGTEEFRYCGARKDVERSYCAYHARMAYTAVASRAPAIRWNLTGKGERRSPDRSGAGRVWQ